MGFGMDGEEERIVTPDFLIHICTHTLVNIHITQFSIIHCRIKSMIELEKL